MTPCLAIIFILYLIIKEQKDNFNYWVDIWLLLCYFFLSFLIELKDELGGKKMKLREQVHLTEYIRFYNPQGHIILRFNKDPLLNFPVRERSKFLKLGRAGIEIQYIEESGVFIIESRSGSHFYLSDSLPLEEGWQTELLDGLLQLYDEADEYCLRI